MCTQTKPGGRPPAARSRCGPSPCLENGPVGPRPTSRGAEASAEDSARYGPRALARPAPAELTANTSHADEAGVHVDGGGGASSRTCVMSRRSWSSKRAGGQLCPRSSRYEVLSKPETRRGGRGQGSGNSGRTPSGGTLTRASGDLCPRSVPHLRVSPLRHDEWAHRAGRAGRCRRRHLLLEKNACLPRLGYGDENPSQSRGSAVHEATFQHICKSEGC